MENLKKLSKFSNGFEIGKTGQSTILGGSGTTGPAGPSGGDQKTSWYESNNPACSMTCLDSKVDTYAN